MSNRDSFRKSADHKASKEPPVVVNGILAINGAICLARRKKWVDEKRQYEIFYDLPGGKADQWVVTDKKTKQILRWQTAEEVLATKINERKEERRPETPQEGLVREFKEEVGVEVIVTSAVPYVSPHPKLSGRDKHFFVCEYVSGTPENLDEGDHEEIVLVSPKEASALLKGRISPEVDYVLKHVNDAQRYRPEPSASSTAHHKYDN